MAHGDGKVVNSDFYDQAFDSSIFVLQSLEIESWVAQALLQLGSPGIRFRRLEMRIHEALVLLLL